MFTKKFFEEIFREEMKKFTRGRPHCPMPVVGILLNKGEEIFVKKINYSDNDIISFTIYDNTKEGSQIFCPYNTILEIKFYEKSPNKQVSGFKIEELDK